MIHFFWVFFPTEWNFSIKPKMCMCVCVCVCVWVYSRVHLTNVLLTGLCLFIFHLEAKVFFPFQLHPAVFFIPLEILDPTPSFQKFSSNFMTAVNLWLSDVLSWIFLFFAFSFEVPVKDTSKRTAQFFNTWVLSGSSYTNLHSSLLSNAGPSTPLPKEKYI